MAYTPISALPTPPSRQEPATFSVRADAFLGALPTFGTQVNAAGDYIDTKAAEVDVDAATASAAAASALAVVNVERWVSGTTYAEGDAVYSTINFLTYRRKSAGSSTTDPSLDTVNWALVVGSANVVFDAGDSVFQVLSLTGEELLNVDATTDELLQVINTDDEMLFQVSNLTGTSALGEFKATSYNETFVAVISTTNATTVNCEAGNTFSHTLTENTTFTFSNPPASGTAYTMTIEIIQDAGAAGYTVTWPTTVDFPAGTAPTLTATASAVDVFVFTTRDGGTNWYGFTAGLGLATPA